MGKVGDGGGRGVGNRGSKPPYLLCLASPVPADFLFCFWLPPRSFFSLQKIRHCRKILPLPILLVLPPLALSSPISHTPPVPYFSQDSIPCLPPTCQYETPKMVAAYIAARTQLSTKLGLYCAFHKHANSEVQKPTDDCIFCCCQSS